MATKNITIMDDAYRILRTNRRKGESFSDVIRRTVKTPDIMKFAGIWKDIPDKEIDDMKARVRERRKEGTNRRRKKQ